MKLITLYTCSSCSYQSPKWLGRCPQCETWNCFVEEVIEKTLRKTEIKAHPRETQSYEKIFSSITKEIREKTEISELDSVLGGGMVIGSLVLLTGEPGIGKSTLTLQIAEAMSVKNKKVLYISAEESESQIALRGKRLNLKLAAIQLLSENSLEIILATAEEEKPDFLIIDSIQVIKSSLLPSHPGSIAQVRLCTEALLNFAKPKKVSVLLIGHVTKDGTLAGPRVLEHLVDSVLYLEGNRNHEGRILRSVKNRFGSVSEVGIFEMTTCGLSEVKNPASFFIRQREEGAVGSCLVMTIEGTRPLILEVQALTNPTVFGYPKRTAAGFDINRLQLLLAVLEKHCGVKLSSQDVYINVAGGYKINDPACDSGVCLAILSSYYKKALSPGLVWIGEVGLSGEVRLPQRMEIYKKEIKKIALALGEVKKTLFATAQLIF